MTRYGIATASLLSLLAGRAAAWGSLGHYTVGYVAQNFLASETKEWAQNIIGITNDSYLAGTATWADSFKYTDEGSFSRNLHYIDAEDDPPKSCGVDFDRDCPEEGCIVTAIANYTARAQDDSLDEEQLQQALKFLVHFIGDIHQPLHAEAAEVGGNNINVTFEGDETNLHSVWDTAIPEKLIGGYQLSFAKTWSSNLTASIKTGKFRTSSKTWLQGLDLKDAQGAAMDWANDANSYVCKTILTDGVEGAEGEEIVPEQYSKAIPVIELMIAKAGYRLAAWLNLIVTGSTKLASTEGAMLHHREADVLSEFAPAVFQRSQGSMLSEARIKRLAWGSDCNCGHKH